MADELFAGVGGLTEFGSSAPDNILSYLIHLTV